MIAVFGGAAVGLLVGVIGVYVFDARWNVFSGISWGIMAGAMGLGISRIGTQQKKDDSEAGQGRNLEPDR